MTRKTYCGNLLWQSGLTLLAPVLTTTVLMLFAGCMQDIIVLSSRDGTVRYKSSIPTRLRRECVFQVDSANQRFYTYQGNDDEAPFTVIRTYDFSKGEMSSFRLPLKMLWYDYGAGNFFAVADGRLYIVCSSGMEMEGKKYDGKETLAYRIDLNSPDRIEDIAALLPGHTVFDSVRRLSDTEIAFLSSSAKGNEDARASVRFDCRTNSPKGPVAGRVPDAVASKGLASTRDFYLLKEDGEFRVYNSSGAVHRTVQVTDLAPFIGMVDIRMIGVSQLDRDVCVFSAGDKWARYDMSAGKMLDHGQTAFGEQGFRIWRAFDDGFILLEKHDGDFNRYRLYNTKSGKSIDIPMHYHVCYVGPEVCILEQ